MTATTIQQSQQLLKLGLSHAQADMYYYYLQGHENHPRQPILAAFPPTDESNIPAWSLDALFKLLPKGCCSLVSNEKEYICSFRETDEKAWYFGDKEPLDAVYQAVEWMLQNGYSNQHIISNMKARSRKTGEIVEIICYSGSTQRTLADSVSYIDAGGDEHTEKLNYYWDFEPIEPAPAVSHETQRQQIATACLLALLSNHDYMLSHRNSQEREWKVSPYDSSRITDIVTDDAVKYADALIKKLKFPK